MTLEEKAKAMRRAIDRMELALMGMANLVDLPEKWSEPRHPKELGVNIRTNCGEVYEVTDALSELNRIVHSEEFFEGNLNAD